MPFVTVPSVLMRGGTSKDVFFAVDDVPGPGPARDLPLAYSATLYRTARTLMRGEICVRVG